MGFERAVQAIDDRDPAALRALLRAEPALVRATDDEGDTLLDHAQGHAPWVGDDPAYWTSPACAEVLLDAGADPGDIVERAFMAGDGPMLEMLVRRGMVEAGLVLAAATGDTGAVRAALPAPLGQVGHALRIAARHGQVDTAAALVGSLDARPWGGARGLATWLVDRARSLPADRSLEPLELVCAVQVDAAIRSDDAEAVAALLDAAPRLMDGGRRALREAWLASCARLGKAAAADVLLRRWSGPPPSSELAELAEEWEHPAVAALLRRSS